MDHLDYQRYLWGDLSCPVLHFDQAEALTQPDDLELHAQFITPLLHNLPSRPHSRPLHQQSSYFPPPISMNRTKPLRSPKSTIGFKSHIHRRPANKRAISTTPQPVKPRQQPRNIHKTKSVTHSRFISNKSASTPFSPTPSPPFAASITSTTFPPSTTQQPRLDLPLTRFEPTTLGSASVKFNITPPRPLHHTSQRSMITRVSSTSNRPSTRFNASLFTISAHQMSTEEKHQEVGVEPPTQQEDTIFGKMSRGEIKVPTVYEDEKCIVINDINPQAKRHMLLMPRKPISQLSAATDGDAELLGHLFNVARKVAASEGLEGYRLVVNNGKEGCQSVYHLHIHILGGQQLTGNFA